MVKIKIARVAADGSVGEEVCTLSFVGTLGPSGGTVGFNNEVMPAVAGSKAFSCGKLMWLETGTWAPGRSWSSARHDVRVPIRVRSSTFEDGSVVEMLKGAIFSGGCVMSNARGEKFHLAFSSSSRATKEDAAAMPPETTIAAEGECGTAGVDFCPIPVAAEEPASEEAEFVSSVEGYAPTEMSEL